MSIKSPKTLVVLVFLVMLSPYLTACAGRPKLKQVSHHAPERPINTPEAAQLLKNRLERGSSHHASEQEGN